MESHWNVLQQYIQMESHWNVLLKLSITVACQITVKSFVLYMFPVPQTGSHIINILLA